MPLSFYSSAAIELSRYGAASSHNRSLALDIIRMKQALVICWHFFRNSGQVPHVMNNEMDK